MCYAYTVGHEGGRGRVSSKTADKHFYRHGLIPENKLNNALSDTVRLKYN